MAILTAEQINFLRTQKISESMLFDASGMSAEARKSIMSELNKLFYFGGAPCKNGGHTLRSKAGHCIQCDTSRIAYQIRSWAAGYVYLAFSANTSLVKVGYSSLHPQDRGAFLRNEAYGNIKDWDIKRFYHVKKNAGQKEFAVHAALEPFRNPLKYSKNPGNHVECREIFKIELNMALHYFDQIMTKD